MTVKRVPWSMRLYTWVPPFIICMMTSPFGALHLGYPRVVGSFKWQEQSALEFLCYTDIVVLLL